MEISEKLLMFSKANDIYEICAPLFKHSFLNYFDYARYMLDGRCLTLTTIPEFGRAYLSNHFYPSLKELSYGVGSNNSFIALLSSNYYHTCQTYDQKKFIENISVASEFKIINRLYIIYKRENYFEHFGFGSLNDSPRMIDALINNIDLLSQYSQYFLEKAESTSLLSEKQMIQLPNFIEPDQSAPELLINRKKILEAIRSKTSTIKFRGKSIHLSPREMECLVLTSLGLSAKEIGKKLSASHRTIENHIDNLKRKLDVTRKTLLSHIAEENKHLINNFSLESTQDDEHNY